MNKEIYLILNLQKIFLTLKTKLNIARNFYVSF